MKRKRLVRCPNCHKRFFLKYKEWSYDKYVTEHSNGIHKTYCMKCSNKIRRGDYKHG